MSNPDDRLSTDLGASRALADVPGRNAVAQLGQQLVREDAHAGARLDAARRARERERALEDEGVRLGLVLVHALLGQEGVVQPDLCMYEDMSIVYVYVYVYVDVYVYVHRPRCYVDT